ncbi:hypothetical protein [Calothrix anomala]|uniref:Uncharacterized protein n=1 Tax=Calothrix anomala FACHB-343 TaxID=2692894 RepID=A0ABR8B174_9CYAN|nr:hypothetical protein [Calothrix anomala]MBD2226621.1 hypothetical protein [Calothrix anomala FACHB-343]
MVISQASSSHRKLTGEGFAVAEWLLRGEYLENTCENTFIYTAVGDRLF